MDGAGEEEVPLAVDHEGARVVGDDGALLREGPRRRRPSREEDRERGGGHQHGRGPDGGHVSRDCGNEAGQREVGNGRWRSRVGEATLARGRGRGWPL